MQTVFVVNYVQHSGGRYDRNTIMVFNDRQTAEREVLRITELLTEALRINAEYHAVRENNLSGLQFGTEEYSRACKQLAETIGYNQTIENSLDDWIPDIQELQIN